MIFVDKYRLSISIAALLAIVTIFFHGSALNGTWRVDDPVWLMRATSSPTPFGYFYSSSLWQIFFEPNFTPWVVLDFELDFLLFGLMPTGYYAHHLLSIWLAAVATFILLNRHLDAQHGAMASMLFLAGSPVTVVGQQLMSRHYVEGLVFMILAITFWLRAAEKERQMYRVLSVGCYIVSMLNKEIFIPLPLVLFFLGKGTTIDRLRASAPFFLFAILFVAWRAAMLGDVIGGASRHLGSPWDIPYSFATMAQMIFGFGWKTYLGSLFLLLSAMVILRSESRALLPMIAVITALVLPFLAISISTDVMHLRYAFVPWWCICILLSLGLASLSGKANISPSTGRQNPNHPFVPRRHAVFLVFTSFFALVFVNGHKISSAYQEMASEFDVQGQFLWEYNEKVGYVSLREIGKFPQFQHGMFSLKNRHLDQNTPVAIPFSQALQAFPSVSSLYVYDHACHCMRDAGMVTLASRSSSNTALPMEIKIDRSDTHAVAWDTKGPIGASFYWVLLNWNGAFPVPASGRLPLPLWIDGPFMLFVLTTDGQWNASPPLLFPAPGQKLQWSSTHSEH